MPRVNAEKPIQPILPTLWLLWAMVVLALLVAWHFIHWPIRQLVVQDPLVYQGQKEVEQILYLWHGRNLLDGQLPQMQQQLEGLPWIKSATLQFVWPDTLVIDLQEQRPIAIWNDQWLINDAGHLFKPEAFAQEWPLLYGPDDSSAQIMNQFLWFSELLAEVEAPLRWVRMENRGAWSLGFEADKLELQVLLGIDPTMARLLRVRDWMQVMHLKLPEVSVIDARYENGLAVTFRHEN